MLPHVLLPVVLALLAPLVPVGMAAPSLLSLVDTGAGAGADIDSITHAHTRPGGEAHLAPLVYARQAQAAPVPVPGDVCEEWGGDEYDDEDDEEEELGTPITSPGPAPVPVPIGEGVGEGAGAGSGGSCAHGEWRCTGSALEMCHYVDTNTLGWVKLHDCPTSCTVGTSIQCV